MDGKMFAWNANNGMGIGIDCTEVVLLAMLGQKVLDGWMDGLARWRIRI